MPGPPTPVRGSGAPATPRPPPTAWNEWAPRSRGGDGPLLLSRQTLPTPVSPSQSPPPSLLPSPFFLLVLTKKKKKKRSVPARCAVLPSSITEPALGQIPLCLSGFPLLPQISDHRQSIVQARPRPPAPCLGHPSARESRSETRATQEQRKGVASSGPRPPGSTPRESIDLRTRFSSREKSPGHFYAWTCGISRRQQFRCQRAILLRCLREPGGRRTL